MSSEGEGLIMPQVSMCKTAPPSVCASMKKLEGTVFAHFLKIIQVITKNILRHFDVSQGCAQIIMGLG